MQHLKNSKRLSISKKSISKSKTKVRLFQNTPIDLTNPPESIDDAEQWNSFNSPKLVKYRAVMLLHALGDTIGFKNGEWEFNNYQDIDNTNAMEYVNELIYEFIDLGGVNGINLSDWRVSDDTFLHIAIGKSLLEYDETNGIDDKLIYITKNNLKLEARRMDQELKGKYIDASSGKKIKINRYIGITTSESIRIFTEENDARSQIYNQMAGGNGSAMRTPIIGVCFGKDKHWDALVDYSIISSQVTHNNALGYLAGFTISAFVAFGMKRLNINKWPYYLLTELRSKKLKEYLPLDNLDHVYDYEMYIRYWQKYIDTRFGSDDMPLKTRAHSNPMHRIRYYYDNFHRDTKSHQIGESGFLCAIMAYDALLDCNGCWEKLIVYSMLHSGDSDTIGAVAGALYGSVYGFGDVPAKMLEHLERKKEIEELAVNLYKKFEKS